MNNNTSNVFYNGSRARHNKPSRRRTPKPGEAVARDELLDRGAVFFANSQRLSPPQNFRTCSAKAVPMVSLLLVRWLQHATYRTMLRLALPNRSGLAQPFLDRITCDAYAVLTLHLTAESGGLQCITRLCQK